MKKTWVRIGLFLLVLGVLLGVGKALGLEAYAKPARLKSMLLGIGVWGYVAYIGLFAVGSLVGIPGLLFVAGGVLIYGKLQGAGIAIFAGVTAVTVQFSIARWVGGKALTQAKWSVIERILKGVDARPVLTVILLRCVTFLSPPVNYALAWSNIRFRDYVVGSAVGLSVALSAMVCIFGSLVHLSGA